MLSQNPEPKLKNSKNRIFVTSHFGTLLLLKLSVVSVIGLINVLVAKRNMFAAKMNHCWMIRNGSKE